MERTNSKIEKRYDISKKYESFFKLFSDIDKDTSSNYKNGEISKELYRHVFKMHYCDGKYAYDFNRERNQAFNEIFQDLIAYYLNVFLDDKYEIMLEKEKDHLRPDILITKNKKNHFIIEVKTNLGWERKAIKDGTLENKITKLNSAFRVKKENIIYVLESPGNVKKKFFELYWNENKSKPQERPKESPFSNIYPLFNITDPYYMEEFDRETLYADTPPFDDKKIEELAGKNIVTKFEEIIELIEHA